MLNNSSPRYIIDSDYKYFNSQDGPNINTVITIANRKKINKENYLYFIRFHKNFENIPTQLFNLPEKIVKNFLDFKKINYSDNILKDIKWGILFNSNDDLMKLFRLLKYKGKIFNEIEEHSFSVGQGLNVSEDFIYNTNLFLNYPFIKNKIIPFMTSEDGSPFELKKTKYFLIDGLELSDDERNEFNNSSINYFIPSDRRFKPFLIMPRGISRYYCTMNIITAYSGSFVEIYDHNLNTPEEIRLNLWLFLNSSVAWLWREISGRKNLGGGLLKAEATDLKVLPIFYDFQQYQKIKNIYNNLKDRDALNTIDELENEEHKKIDSIVFEYLGLKISEQRNIVEILKKLLISRCQKSKT